MQAAESRPGAPPAGVAPLASRAHGVVRGPRAPGAFPCAPRAGRPGAAAGPPYAPKSVPAMSSNTARAFHGSTPAGVPSEMR